MRIPKTLMTPEILLCLCYRSMTLSVMEASEMLSLLSGTLVDILSLQLTFIIIIITFSLLSQKIVSYRIRTCAGKPIWFRIKLLNHSDKLTN